MKLALLASLAILSALALGQASPIGVPPSQDTAPPVSTPTALQGALERLGGTYVYDPLTRKATLALTYRTATLTDVLGRKGLDLDVTALAGATGGSVTLGTGFLFTKELRLDIAKELRGSLGLTVGPALLYGSNGGKLHLGAVLGLGFKF